MKRLFTVLFIFLAACGQQKSSNQQDQAMENISAQDTLQVEPSVEFVTGQFDYRKQENFVQVAKKYADKEIYLQKRTYQALKAMFDSARKDGITFTIISGTRNFYNQKGIWERKWENFEAPSDLQKALKILNYSSMPMTSRHHWGTDV